MASTSATSSDPPTPALVIETADGQIFELSEEQANLIGLFRDMLDFTGGNDANLKKDGKSSTTTGSNKAATSNSSFFSAAGPSKPSKDEKMKKEMEKKKPIKVNVDGTAMSLVLQWLHQHKDDTEVIEGITDEAFCERTLPEWDQAFFGPLKWPSLAALITAANNLDINSLLFYTAKAIVGSMNVGMTTEQMRAYTTVDENGPTLEVEENSKQDGEKKEEKEEKKMEEN